jgi:uncharacterized protein (DUF1501 family)
LTPPPCHSDDIGAVAGRAPVRVSLGGRRHPTGGSRLVVVELGGGNDALDAVVTFAYPACARLWPKLKLDPKQFVRLNAALALYPALRPLAVPC